MCIKFGGPYVSLCPQGRKPNDQTIKGYPDAYAKLPDGRLLVVEITAGDWRTHLEADLVKLKKLANTGIAEISFFTMQDADTLLPQSNANKTKQNQNVLYNTSATNFICSAFQRKAFVSTSSTKSLKSSEKLSTQKFFTL